MRIGPGCTEFTRISGPSSAAADLLMPRTPHFDAPYAPCPAYPSRPAADEMFTIDDLPAARSAGAQVRIPRKVPTRFTRRMRSKSSTDSSSMRTMWWMAALLTSTSR